MTTYRAKPAECEAMQWVVPDDPEVPLDLATRALDIVKWITANGGEARYDPEYVDENGPQTPAHIAICTVTGWACAAPGQYIVKGIATFTVRDNIGGQDIEKELRNFYPRDPVTFETLWSADPARWSVLNALRHENQKLRQALVTSESKVEHLSVVLDDERKRRIHDIQRVRRLTDLLLRQPAHGWVNSNDSDTEDVHDDF